MPVTPTSCSAFFTSSSLNGLMIASIFFIGQFPSATRCPPRRTICARARPGARLARSEYHPGFHEEAALRFGAAGPPEPGARGDAADLHDRAFAAQEIDAFLPGRGQ